MKKLLFLLLLFPFLANAQINGTLQKTTATGIIRGNFGSSGLDTLPPVRLTGITNGMTLIYNDVTKKFHAGTATASFTVSTVSPGGYANGLSYTSGVLRLGKVSATNPGVLTTGADTLAGVKTFNSDAVIHGLTVGRGGGAVITNSATGWSALINNTTSGFSTAFGYASLVNATGGSNSSFGASGFGNLTTGINNTSIGYNSGGGIVSGSGNTIIGANVGGLATGLTNNIILANGTGAIKAQHDGTNWTFTGGIVSPNLTGVPIAPTATAGTITTQLATTSFVTTADNLKANLASPTFTGTVTAPTFSGALTGNASTATSLSGGLGGQIPYQSSVNATAFLANGTSGQVLRSNGTTLAPSWTTDGGGTVIGSGTISYLPKFTATSTLGNSLIYDSGTAIGIGTASPAVTLHVKGTDGGSISMQNSASVLTGNRGTLAWYNSSASTVASIDATALTDNVGTGLSFKTRPVAGSLTEGMFLGSDGFLGIGSGFTPLVPLHLKSTSPAVAMQNSASVISGTRAAFNWFNSSTSTVASIQAVANTDNVGTGLEFYTRPVAGSLTKTFDISSAAVPRFSGLASASTQMVVASTDGSLSVQAIPSGGGGGTVASVGVASLNGLAGTSSGGANPTLTLSTTLSGIVKANGTAFSAATDGTDYINGVTGTANRISAGTGADPVIDISSAYVGQTSITTLGIIGTGTWQGIAIADSYISSAATWNAKAPLASPTFTGTVSGITAAMVGAPSGSGTSTGANTGDQNLAPYATLASPALTGTPTAPTATAGTNTTQLATTAFVQAANLNLTSGTYTPTLTVGTNVNAVVSGVCHYIRVGSEVTVTGRSNITTTNTGNSFFSVSLPIASNMTTGGDLSGTGSGSNSAVYVFVEEDTTSDVANVNFTQTTGTNITQNIYFTFTYIVR